MLVQRAVASRVDDRQRRPRVGDERRDVVAVGGDDLGSVFDREHDDGAVDDVGRLRSLEKRAYGMRVSVGERNDVASTKESAELHLATRAAHVRDNGRRDERDDTRFEPHAVLGPQCPIVALGRDERSRVVDGVVHAPRGRRRVRAASRRRAASSSASVGAPCRCSHSRTATRPSRTSSARRAAAVIHAETLNAFGGRGCGNAGVNVGIDSDRHLRRRIAPRHPESILQ